VERAPGRPGTAAVFGPSAGPAFSSTVAETATMTATLTATVAATETTPMHVTVAL
jgi:hypothetical protein